MNLKELRNSSNTTTPSQRSKYGWHNNHEKLKKLLSRQNSNSILIGDSIIAGLLRYKNIWQKHFKATTNLGIGGDRTQNVLWRTERLTFSSSIKYAVIQCGVNNIDIDPPIDIANGIITIALTIIRKKPGINVIITGLLPRNQYLTNRRQKIDMVNHYLEKSCINQTNTNFNKQSGWTHNNGNLINKYYYRDNLHLVESGN